MFTVIKNKGKIQNAYRLGDDNLILNQLICEGKIKKLGEGKYEIFSAEVEKSGAEHGEIAQVGDYVKLDSNGKPYPNSAEFFEANHRHISGDEYEQIPKVLFAWDIYEPMCKEVEFLIQKKGLILNETCHERYYTSPLWGTIESADKDAVVIFYDIVYTAENEIEDISFNFVARNVFDTTYNKC